MTELPVGWCEIRTDEAGRIDLGRQRSPKYHSGSNMQPYLRVANVFEDRIDTSDVKTMHFEPADFERFRLSPGEVLLNEGQSPQFLGRPAIYRGDPPNIAFTNSLIRFRANDAVLPEWALAVFRHHMHSGRFTQESRITTNIAHLSSNRLASVEFRVPPRAEQQRIVLALDEAFSKLDAGEAALRTVRQKLKRMREAVLAAAVTGQLVPQDSTDTTASKLLADFGVVPMGEVQRVIPIGWEWARVGDLAEVISGPAFPSSEFKGPSEGIRLLRGENIEPGRLRWRDTKTWPDSLIGGFEHLCVGGDDLILAMDRPLVTAGLKLARVKATDLPALLVQRVARIRARNPKLIGIITITLQESRFSSHLLRGQVGTQLPHITLRDIRDYPIAVPPEAEQHRIVEEVERQFSVLDACERAVDAGLARSAALRRSVLRAAFEGRLVPQDSTDEPASVLLERVRAERAASGPAKHGRGRKKVETS